MNIRDKSSFITVQTQGSILPADLLRRVAGGDGDLQSLKESDYHLVSETFNEAISRSWSKLVSVWKVFRPQLDELPDTDAGTGVTRERWILPLFQELGYGRLPISKAIEIEGKTYPVSHHWENTPIHLLGINVDLNKAMPGVAGAARMSPHSLVQEYLNRSKGILWAFLCNGRKLRILRDNVSLTRQSYVEFDLQAMMDGEIYSDFALMWLLCHQSRVEGESHTTCWLEKWSHAAQDQGVRALEQLRGGVKDAIEALGKGFLSNPLNNTLREKLRNGTLAKGDYYWQVLRLVYRIIFFLAAEERGLLHKEGAPTEAVERYVRFYSIGRVRGIAEKLKGSRHTDLYRTFALMVAKLNDDGCPELALEPLGGYLFSDEATADLQGCHLNNRDFLSAVRNLSFVTYNNMRRHVDYRNLGSEELGSVYESLLELHPDIDVAAANFSLGSVGGSERKTTGSYYTPSSLVQCLLESALDPVLYEAAKSEDPEKAILNLKVCDPACGSGHFIVAAAHRIARQLATIRSKGEEPSPAVYGEALRDVISHCIYGVDLNPMAVELCRVNLWMEAMVPGKPLTFLDHHIKCGNSLLGTTPALMADGIPDEAFKPIDGDDKEVVSILRKKNTKARKGLLSFDFSGELVQPQSTLSKKALEVNAIEDGSVLSVRAKKERYNSIINCEEYRTARLTADAWCAAFVWIKTKGILNAPTHDVYLRLIKDAKSISTDITTEVERLSEQYQFFHWHIAFPDIFQIPGNGESADNEKMGWSGGFDMVLGNPPWERIKLQEKEWFAERRPDIANAPNAADRKSMIGMLGKEDPTLYNLFQNDLRQTDGEGHLIRSGGRFPLTAQGDINTYSIFAEHFTNLQSPSGRAGMIVPSGVATDDSTKEFFAEISSGKLVSLFDFENRARIFPSVDSRFKFCLLTLGNHVDESQFSFFLTNTAQLDDDRRCFTLSAEEIRLLNPNTRTCPVFRSQADAELTKKIYRNVPVLINEDKGSAGNPWGISFLRMLDMSNDSVLFRTAEQLSAASARREGNAWIAVDRTRWLPLYESKMVHQFDHRWATYEANGADSRDVMDKEKINSAFEPMPRYWVPQTEVEKILVDKGWQRGWLMGWRDICRSTDERTVISSIIPWAGVGNNMPLMLFAPKVSATSCASLVGCLNSLILDFVARHKVGGTHLNFFIAKQLPILPPSSYSQDDLSFIVPRVLELTYTSHSLQSWAQDLGYSGSLFPWNPERRATLRAELDAYYALLYGVNRDALRYVLDPADVMGAAYPSETFRVLKEKEVKKYGEYRTRGLVLEAYDKLQGSVSPVVANSSHTNTNQTVAVPEPKKEKSEDFVLTPSPVNVQPSQQPLLTVIKPLSVTPPPVTETGMIHTDKVSHDPEVWSRLSKWVRETRSINEYWAGFAQTLAVKLQNNANLIIKEKQDMEKCWKQAVKKGFSSSGG